MELMHSKAYCSFIFWSPGLSRDLISVDCGQSKSIIILFFQANLAYDVSLDVIIFFENIKMAQLGVVEKSVKLYAWKFPPFLFNTGKYPDILVV